MQGENVRLPERLVQRYQRIGAVLGLGACGDQHLHAERCANGSDFSADAAVSHHCQLFSGEFLHGIGHDAEGLCLFPRPLPDSSVILCHTAVVVEDQGKGVLRHSIGGIARHVADGHAVRLRCGNVDVVVARSALADIAQLRALIEDRSGNGGLIAQHRIRIGDALRQLFRRGQVVDRHLCVPGEALQRNAAAGEGGAVCDNEFHAASSFGWSSASSCPSFFRRTLARMESASAPSSRTASSAPMV